MKNLHQLIIFLLAVSISSCKKTDPVPNIPIVNAHTFLALGDSYTIGQSVSADQRFPNQTAGILRSQGFRINDPNIIATTGWTTGNLLSALNANPPSQNYSIVTLLIGVNNQYQGRSLDEYRLEFNTLVSKAITYAGNKSERVFVLSIPDYSVTPFAQNSDTAYIARQIDLFNQVNKSIAAASSVNYIDITAISRQGRTDNSLHATDGLHPSGKQYLMWSELLAQAIRLRIQ